MNWGIVISGFGLGTFKFLFAHWMVYGVSSNADFQVLTEIFISVTAGAWFSMSIFYFLSGFLMKRAREKRELAVKLAKENGTELKKKKIFILILSIYYLVKGILIGSMMFTLLKG